VTKSLFFATGCIFKWRWSSDALVSGTCGFMAQMNIQVNGQPVQLADIVARLNIEDRINLSSSIEGSLEKDLMRLLSQTRKCGQCFICKKYLYENNYESLCVLLTNQKTCGHVFHTACINSALIQAPKCPVCHSENVFTCSIFIDH
jgi:predicted Zn-ribbon and HTH transcriptional regulator